MAFYLEKQQTTSTPYILIDEKNNYMKMEGSSFHEDVINFYKEIDIWLEKYLQTNFGKFTFDCEMSYFNSSTVKILLNLIMKMDKYPLNDNKVVINWITAGKNEIVIECGEDFKEEVSNIIFNIVIIE